MTDRSIRKEVTYINLVRNSLFLYAQYERTQFKFLRIKIKAIIQRGQIINARLFQRHEDIRTEQQAQMVERPVRD